MTATVVVGGEEAPPFEVRNGLRQGCTIAPTLFFFNTLNKLSSVGYIAVML